MNIHPRKDEIPRDLIDGFRHVDPATVGHFIHFGFLDHGVQPLWRPVKVVGPAFTIRTPGMDSTMLHRAFEYLQPGDVLVIDRCGDMVHAGFGGLTAYASMRQGLAGVVVDGLVTDLKEIKEYELPVFARGLTNITTKMSGVGGDINVPVSVGGTTVRPGDLVVADDNGVLVLDPEEAPALLERAREAEAGEKRLKEKIDAGASLTDLTGTRNLLDAGIPEMLRDIRKRAESARSK